MRSSPIYAGLGLTALLALPGAPAATALRKAPPAHTLSLESVNDAQWSGTRSAVPRQVLVKAQVLLDRAHASPGQIDANRGENTRKAIAAFREMRNLGSGDRIDAALWRALTEADEEPVLTTYTVREKDVAGPFIGKLPSDFRAKARLPRLAYTSALQLLAEKFHMSERLLRELNPGAALDRAGKQIVVANVVREQLPRKIARIEVDGGRQRVLAFDKDAALSAVYPATVGSSERPSPSGEFKVTAVAENPAYHYDPSLNFKEVEAREPLDLAPGPNNPVGVVWIALSAKGYG